MPSCRLQIRVLPNAKRTAWAGIWNGSHYKIALQAPAVDGKANDALIAFLSDFFNLPKRSFSIILGQTSRSKVIQIDGLHLEDLNLPPLD